jgi:uncharacterized membrane protein YdjX (TVP38/TMEM64 family)
VKEGQIMPAGSPTAAERLVPIVRWTLVVVTAVAVVVMAAGLIVSWERDLSVQAIEDTILAWGSWGVLASIALMVLHSFVPFPAELVAFANGMVYGPLWGTVITWTGAMLGAFAAFGLARAFGRPFVAHMVARKNWQVLDEWTARQGGTMVLVGRFIPVISFNLINYAAGLTRISWWTFAWTTGVGILPLTAVMVIMGHRIESLSPEAWLALVVGGVALWWLVRRQLRRARASADIAVVPRQPMER